MAIIVVTIFSKLDLMQQNLIINYCFHFIIPNMKMWFFLLKLNLHGKCENKLQNYYLPTDRSSVHGYGICIIQLIVSTLNLHFVMLWNIHNIDTIFYRSCWCNKSCLPPTGVSLSNHISGRGSLHSYGQDIKVVIRKSSF